MNYNYKDLIDNQLLESLLKESHSGSFKALLSEDGLEDLAYDLTPHELMSIKGIGPKTTDRLIDLQELIRCL